jgi:hypothetical protein
METYVFLVATCKANTAAKYLSLFQISEQMIRLVGLLKRDEGDESAKDVLEVRQFGEEEITVDSAGAKEEEADEELDIEVL